jgi:hypothetical protein
MLMGVYGTEMAYRDPHTAAPALWALRQLEGCEFEASVSEFNGAGPNRKGLETLAITLYRLESGHSPTANFGRMPAGFRSSTGNNARLVAAGRRARGGLDPDALPAAGSAPVHGDVRGDPTAATWMGWTWSPWAPVGDRSVTASGVGLYRLGLGGPGLVYVGQGRLAARLKAHLTKVGMPAHRQSPHLAGYLEVSWVKFQHPRVVNMLEHENDLIAADMLSIECPPPAQFLG